MASSDSANAAPLNAVPLTTVPPTPNPEKATSSKSIPKKPLPNPSIFFKSATEFTHANALSTMTEKSVQNVYVRYQVPATHQFRCPTATEKMYQCPDGWTAMPLTLLEKGVRFPLHVFLVTLLGFIGVGFAQLVPNSYIHILAFIAFCHEVGVAPTLDFFFSIYSVSNSREKGFKLLGKLPSKTGEDFERRSLVTTPSSNKKWYEQWFFVKGPEIASLPDWTTLDKVSVDLGDISEERINEMIMLLYNFPKKAWSYNLLTKQAWLYDHKLSLIKPSSSDRKDLEKFLSGKPPTSPPAETPQEEIPASEAPDVEDIPVEAEVAEEILELRKKKRAVRKPRIIVQEPPTTSTTSLIDMPDDERIQILRTKKRRTHVVPLSAEELRVPTALTRQILIAEEEPEAQTEAPILTRKRKEPSTDQPPLSAEPIPDQSLAVIMSSPTRASSPVRETAAARSPSPENIYMDPSPSSSPGERIPFLSIPSADEFENDAKGTPTIWPHFNANYPFHLFDAFVRETDEHRFGNSSIMDLIKESMSYHAKSSAILGRLLPRYREVEAEEDAARRENAILKSAWNKARTDLGDALFNNENLQKDLTERMDELKLCKEDLKKTKASQQEMTSLNVDLDTQNHALRLRNEELCIANQSLAIQADNLQEQALIDKEQSLKIRRELQDKFEALQALGPPLTEELREKVYDEYRKSDELNQKVVKMFSDGYYDCRRKDKAKLVTIEADPTILDSSEDEAAA